MVGGHIVGQGLTSFLLRHTEVRTNGHGGHHVGQVVTALEVHGDGCASQSSDAAAIGARGPRPFGGRDLHTRVDLLAGPNHLVVSLLDEGRSLMGGEVVKQLLLAFIHSFWAAESFEVGKADVGDVAVCGFGNAGEEVDLFLVVGAHLDHHKFGLRRGVEQRQWHANVVVQVAQGGVHMVPCGQHVTDEFFRGGFAVASCHGEHWTRPAPAISPGQGLQGAKGILHDRDVGSAFPLPIRGDGVGRPLIQGVLHKGVPVEVGAFQGHKHHSLELSPGVGGHTVGSISGRKQSQQGRVSEVDHGVLRQRKTPQPSCGVR